MPGVLSPGVKRPERNGDHSPPISAEVKTRLYGVVLNYLSTGTTLRFNFEELHTTVPVTVKAVVPKLCAAAL
jgi:hypothetical protein